MKRTRLVMGIKRSFTQKSQQRRETGIARKGRVSSQNIKKQRRLVKVVLEDAGRWLGMRWASEGQMAASIQ
jgi:hypothetical protein